MGLRFSGKHRFPFRKVQIFISQSTDFRFAKYRFSFRKVQIFISQSTDFHFAKYRFHFAKYRISFRIVQVSFRKVQIFISQSTDFISFRFAKYHFAKYNKPSSSYICMTTAMCFLFFIKSPIILPLCSSKIA